MKKHLHLLTALGVLVLFIGISAAQAAQPNQVIPGGGIINIPIPSNTSWSVDYIYTASDAGSDASIAFDPDHNQMAWISFYNATAGGLYAARFVGTSGGNCGADSAWFCEPVDVLPGVVKGWSTSIDIFPDINPSPFISTWKVGISYFDATNKSLKYAQYTCPPLNPCDWTVSTVYQTSEPSDEIGRYNSLKFGPTGVPNIAFLADWGEFNTNALYHSYFVGSGGGNCIGGSNWQCDLVDQFVSLGPYLSMDIDWIGNVNIAYYDGLNERLKYAYYAGIGDCFLDNGWICPVIDDPAGADVGLFPTIHAPQDINDYMRIAYYDATNGELKYAYTLGKALGNCGPGNNWWCDSIDDMGIGLTNASVSLAVDPNYKPMIAYTDGTSGVTYQLKLAEPVGDPSEANCGGEILFNWICSVIDSQQDYALVGQYASLGIKDNGLAMIAYSSWLNQQPGNYDLKLAFEVMNFYLPLNMK